MNISYCDIALMICALSGLVLGFDCLRPKKPLYSAMIVMGLGCFAIGKAYTLTRQITGLETSGIFHVGILGIVGAFAFFFSSNFGQIDSLVDDGSRKNMIYRIIPITASTVIIGIYAVILLSPASAAEKIADGLAALAASAAGYYHLKHLLIPDVDYGIVRCLRGYNALALVFCFGAMTELTASAYSCEWLRTTACVVESVILVLIVPIMKRGVRNWSR